MQDFKGQIKSIGKTVLFFLILAVILMVVSRLMCQASMDNDSMTMSRNKSITGILKEPEGTIDVLVLGDSLSYCSISPMQLWQDHGITAYVCGQSGQKIQEAYYMLKTALENQQPKLVILETNTMFRSKGRLKDLENALVETGNYYLSVFRYHDMWKSVLTGKQYEGESYKGFRIKNKVKAYGGGNYMEASEETAEIPEIARYYTEEIIRLCRENGTELLLVSTPSPDHYSDATHRALSEYAQAHSLDYLDLNHELEAMKIDWQTDSLDGGDHLNYSGACKVTDYIGRYVTSHDALPDHREDAAYEKWHDDAKKYEARVRGIDGEGKDIAHRR